MATRKIPHGNYTIFVSDDGCIVDATVKDSLACLVAAIGIAMLLLGWGFVGSDLGDTIMAIGFVAVILGPAGVIMFVEPKMLAAYAVGTDYPGVRHITSRIIPNDKTETTRLLCAAISRMRDVIDAGIKADENKVSALKDIVSNCK